MVSASPDLSAGLCIYPANRRVTDGARTRDLRDHNPMLCLLSYGHQAIFRFYQQAPGLQNVRVCLEESRVPCRPVSLGFAIAARLFALALSALSFLVLAGTTRVPQRPTHNSEEEQPEEDHG